MLAGFHFAYFLLHFIYLFCVAEGELLMYHDVHEGASGVTLRGPMDPGHQTQTAKLASRNLYYLSHLASPSFVLDCTQKRTQRPKTRDLTKECLSWAF